MSKNYHIRRSLPSQRMRPSWQTYYDIGVQVSKLLPANASYEEIGRRFGITKQNAYTETVVALGKLVYRIRQSINFEKV